MSKPPTGTLTFLFTDIEDSTRLWEERTEEMRQALARHDAALRGVIYGHGGSIVKMTGDGVFAVFGTTLEAVASAAESLRTLASDTSNDTAWLRIRVGIHTGTAEERDGDFYGTAPNLTNRLMGAAHGGQIVLSAGSANAVRDSLPHGLGLVDLGEHRLRGVALPQHLYQLTIAGFRSEFPPLQSVDAYLGDVTPTAPFAPGDEELAGRRVELDRLENAWKHARDGVRQVALVAGEPGIGKTRLAAELSRRASDQGAVVLYGRCDEEAIVPYQPFVEALRESVAAYSSATLHEGLHGLEQDLARVFPELLGRLSEEPRSISSDAESERYRLFEAITALVAGITATHSVVLILDDLHWAEKPTLLLLRHLVRSVQDAELLIVVCYREMELARDHPLAKLVADLRREPFVTWVGLAGLSEAESRTLLERVSPDEVDASVIAALHRETGGNPLFLEELLRHLIETDGAPLRDGETGPAMDLAPLDLPESVRDVVARRLRRLPEPVNDVLGVAAVIGVEFDAPLIGRAAQQPTKDVLDALDQATDARLVREDPGRLGWYAFSHALIRQAVYGALGTAGRAQLHARVGAAIEENDRVGSAAALAQHFTQAVALVGAAKAIEYTTKAGHEAAADLAFEDAVGYFERAVDLLEQHAPTDQTRRVELLTDLADALIAVDETAAIHAALRAVDAARANGSPEQFGRAVAVFAAPYSEMLYPGRSDQLLDEAQQKLGDAHPALRARLTAIEAFKYSAYQLYGRDGRVLAERAVRLARDAADAPTLAAALFARAISLASTSLTTERLALGEELVALGRAGDGQMAMATTQGLRVVAGVHLELGAADPLTATIAELGRTGEELRWLPALVFAAQWRATQAMLEGRFEDVRACWDDMRQHARAYRAVASIEGQQAFYLAREQGELATFLGPAEQIAAGIPESLYGPAMLAVAQLDTGDTSAALRSFNALTADEVRRGATKSGWGGVLALLTEVAVGGGSESQTALLYELLDPFAGRLLAAVIGLACFGAAERYQGMLATTLELWDDAEA
ncbi:MAG TPA: AAA family ATPase, partial [Acidimicrobiia bacterium]|nr:AAA family ATPase [Acidimicrobiia bacterium]